MDDREHISMHLLGRVVTARRASVSTALVLGCAILCSSISIFPAAAQSPNSTPFTLHIQRREVILDVVVTDRKGNFVGNLTKDAFSVLEDGTRQNVVSFQQPSMHIVPEDASEVTSSRDLDRIGDAPVTVLVLDELNTNFEDMTYARGALRKWLLRQPVKLAQPTVLLSVSDSKFGVVHDYTQSRDALLLALREHFPAYPYRMAKGGSTGPDAGERMALSLGSVQQIAEASSGTRGRKNVIWVGIGFPTLLLDDVPAEKEEEIAAAVERTTTAMLKARITLNVVDPTAMATNSLDMNNPDYLNLATLAEAEGPTSSHISGILNFEEFAPETGGLIYRGHNDVDHEIQQAVDNGSNYYTLVYSPTSVSENLAQFRNIRVVMKDASLSATTRSGYFPEPATPPGIAPKPPSTHDLAFDLMNAALSSMVYNGLTLEAIKDPAGYTLLVGADNLDPHILADGQRVAEVTVMQVCFGRKHRLLEHAAYEVETFELPSQQGGHLLKFHVATHPIPAGTERMRMVVRDAISGHIGTIDIENP